MHFSQLCMYPCGGRHEPTRPCPTDKPIGVTAGPPECLLEDFAGRKYCALTCECYYDVRTGETDCLRPSTGCDMSGGGYCDVLNVQHDGKRGKGVCAWPTEVRPSDEELVERIRQNWQLFNSTTNTHGWRLLR